MRGHVHETEVETTPLGQRRPLPRSSLNTASENSYLPSITMRRLGAITQLEVVPAGSCRLLPVPAQFTPRSRSRPIAKPTKAPNPAVLTNRRHATSGTRAADTQMTKRQIIRQRVLRTQSTKLLSDLSGGLQVGRLSCAEPHVGRNPVHMRVERHEKPRRREIDPQARPSPEVHTVGGANHPTKKQRKPLRRPP